MKKKDEMYRLTTYCFLLLMALLSSCVNEPLYSLVEEGKPVTLGVGLDSRAGGVAIDKEIQQLRIAILGKDGFDVYYNQKYPDVAAGSTIKISTTSGVRDIYFIANDPSGRDFDGDRLSERIITEQHITYTPVPSSPGGAYTPVIPMITSAQNEVLEPYNLSHQIKASLERRMVKVTVNLNRREDVGIPYRLELRQVQIIDLPRYYHWVNRPYIVNDPQSELKTSEIQNVKLLETPVTGFDQSSQNVFYVPSYMVFGENRAKIKITVEQFEKDSDTSTGTKDYYFEIGDGAVKGATPGTPYNLSPNTHYNTTITVKGLPTINIDVIDWNRQSVGGDITPDVNISSPIAVVMDYKALGNSYNTISTFSATDLVKAYVNGKEIPHGAKLTDYTPAGVDMSWLSNSTLSYNSDGMGGELTLAYDPSNTNIDETNYRLTVELKCRTLTKRFSVIAGSYAGVLDSDLGDWDYLESISNITDKSHISSMPFVEINTASMASEVSHVVFPYSASSDVTLSIAGHQIEVGQIINLETLGLTQGWLREVRLYDGNIELHVIKGATIPPEDSRYPFTLSINNERLIKHLHATYILGNENIGGDHEDWETDNPDGNLDKDNFIDVIGRVDASHFEFVEDPDSDTPTTIYEATIPFRSSKQPVLSADGVTLTPGDITAALGRDWIASATLILNADGKSGKLLINFNDITPTDDRERVINFVSGRVSTALTINYDLNNN